MKAILSFVWGLFSLAVNAAFTVVKILIKVALVFTGAGFLISKSSTNW